MATTVNAANVSIGLDVSKLKEGGVKARSEINLVSQVVKAGVSPSEKYSNAVALMAKAVRSGAIDFARSKDALAKYAESIGHETAAAKKSREEKERLIAREKELQAAMARAKQLRESVMTGEERHRQLMRQYNRDLNQGIISRETYNRLLAKSAAANITQAIVPPRVDQGFAAVAGSAGRFLVATVGITASIGLARNALSGFLSTAQEIDAVADRANQLGMSYSELIVAQRALGEISGLGSDEISMAMQKMQLNLLEARQGTSDLAKSLNLLGLEPEKLLKAGNLEAIKQISVQLKQMQNPAEQMKLAFDLMGRSGVGLVVALRAGADPIENMERHLRASGLLLDDLATASISNMNDGLERANDHIQGMQNKLVTNIAPAVTAIANGFVSIADKAAQGNGLFGSAGPAVGNSLFELSRYVSITSYLTGSMRPAIVSLGAAQLEVDRQSIQKQKEKRDAEILTAVETKKLDEEQKELLRTEKERLETEKEIQKQFEMQAERRDLERDKEERRQAETAERERRAMYERNAELVARKKEQIADVKSNTNPMNVSQTIAPALKAGSVEAYKFFLQQKDKANEYAQKQLKALQDINTKHDRLIEAVKGQPKIGLAR